jgi:hypothetical protein
VADFGGAMAGLSCACSAGGPSDGREYCGGGGGRRSMLWRGYVGVALEESRIYRRCGLADAAAMGMVSARID